MRNGKILSEYQVLKASHSFAGFMMKPLRGNGKGIGHHDSVINIELFILLKKKISL